MSWISNTVTFDRLAQFSIFAAAKLIVIVTVVYKVHTMQGGFIKNCSEGFACYGHSHLIDRLSSQYTLTGWVLPSPVPRKESIGCV